jgi:hypothetical protein
MLAVLLIALALLIVAAPPAGATYPGGNGDLLITERSNSHAFDDSSHLLRVDPSTGALTRTQICAQTLVFGFAGPWCNDVIYTVRARGGRARRLTRGFHPVWSPDGKQIAFFREVRTPAYGQKTTYLFALDLGTGRARRVYSEALATHAGFQPNGLDWQAAR